MNGIYLIGGPPQDWSGGEGIHFVNAVSEVPRGAEAVVDFLFVPESGRLSALAALQPALVAVGSVQHTLQELPEGFVRFNDWPGFSAGGALEAAAEAEAVRGRTGEIFLRLGKKVEWVPDQPGFLTPRIVASIINEAVFALGEGVSSEEEIDTALRLGTAYPFGPFEWAEAIGRGRVADLLRCLSAESGRYTPAPGMDTW